jgi:hypothetical protein
VRVCVCAACMGKVDKYTCKIFEVVNSTFYCNWKSVYVDRILTFYTFIFLYENVS